MKHELLVSRTRSFHLKASLLPGLDSSFDCLCVGVPRLHEFQHRTGAIFLVWSESIKYDLVISIEVTVGLGHSSYWKGDWDLALSSASLQGQPFSGGSPAAA